jgi:hypothetical protein
MLPLMYDNPCCTLHDNPSRAYATAAVRSSLLSKYRQQCSVLRCCNAHRVSCCMIDTPLQPYPNPNTAAASFSLSLRWPGHQQRCSICHPTRSRASSAGASAGSRRHAIYAGGRCCAAAAHAQRQALLLECGHWGQSFVCVEGCGSRSCGAELPTSAARIS